MTYYALQNGNFLKELQCSASKMSFHCEGEFDISSKDNMVMENSQTYSVLKKIDGDDLGVFLTVLHTAAMPKNPISQTERLKECECQRGTLKVGSK